ncbi:MAG: hypothetical protein AAGF92_03110 [Myxococcota bacterium]
MALLLRTLAVIGTAACLLLPPTEAHADFAGGQPWGLEFGFGWGRTRSSEYIRTLEDFSYQRDSRTDFRASFALSRRLVNYFELLFQFNSLDDQSFERSAGIGFDDTFKFSTLTFGIHGRTWFPTPNDRFRAYAQFGVGPSVAVTRLRTRLAANEDRTEFRDSQWFYSVTSLLGIEGMPSEHVGLFLNGGYIYAPVPENRFGQRHNGGGGLVIVGVTARFGKTP